MLVLLRAGGVPAGQAAWGVNLLLQQAVATAAEHGTRRETAGAGAPAEFEVLIVGIAASEIPPCPPP